MLETTSSLLTSDVSSTTSYTDSRILARRLAAALEFLALETESPAEKRRLRMLGAAASQIAQCLNPGIKFALSKDPKNGID